MFINVYIKEFIIDKDKIFPLASNQQKEAWHVLNTNADDIIIPIIKLAWSFLYLIKI